MKFELDCMIEVGDTSLPAASVLESAEKLRDSLSDLGSIEGQLVLLLNGRAAECGGYSDPVLRLAGHWLRKVPWVIAGDTETVALRNSEHVFAFVPAGNAVEISFFEGDEAEIAEYVLEPTNVLMKDFAEQSIRLGGVLLELIKTIDASLLESNEDCRDLAESHAEATRAWHDHQLHQRR